MQAMEHKIQVEGSGTCIAEVMYFGAFNPEA